MKTRIAVFLLAAVIFVLGPIAGSLTAKADAAPVTPCSMSTPTGPAPCPPPIVSTNGDSIGGGANTDPINMGDLPHSGTVNPYERPDYFDKPVEPEAPADGEDEGGDASES
ncbi:membrane protein [Gordonia phage Outis]|nr:membrane protein [Gordonia phage StarStruck]WKW85049.1 membrane protein [Gordonia phage Outis]